VAGPATYSLITDFFAPQQRVKAFFAFSIFQQLGDTFQFMTTSIITNYGWKKTWWICGMFAVVNGLIIVLTIVEPPR